MKKLSYYLALAFVLVSFAACDLEELPVATATRPAIFGSPDGMQLYVNSFTIFYRQPM